MTTAVLTAPRVKPPAPIPKRAVGIAVSLAVHAVALGLVLAWKPSALPHIPASETLIYLDIEPIELPAVPLTRAAPPYANDGQSASGTAPPAPVPRMARNLPLEGRFATEQAFSSQPSTASPADRTADRWQYRPESPTAAVARATRTSPIGCAYPERLSEGERAICAERATNRAVQKLEEGQRIAGTGNTRRDAALEVEGRARENGYNFRRRPITADETGNGRPTDTPGSNFGLGPSGRHLDPSLQPDAYGPIQTYRRDGRPEERDFASPR